MNQKYLLLFILLLSFIFLPMQNVYGHAMLIEHPEDNVVRVVFDDGTANRHAEVIIISAEGEEIGRGNVERDGTFEFSLEEGMLVIAQDNFGHRAEYLVGEEPGTVLPRLPVIGLVLAGFGAIAGFFHYRVQKRKA